jgi:exonuclease VII small subunit
MRLQCTAVAVALTAASQLAAAAMALPGPAFPQFDSVAALAAHCEQGLQRAKAGLRKLEKHPADVR